MDVDHHILHFGVVNGSLSLRAPRIDGCFVSAEDADHMQAFRVRKSVTAWVCDAPAHDEVELLLRSGFFHRF